jgi:actin-related protein 5
MKANSDARKIQKVQRLEDKRVKEEEAAREQDERDRDLAAWSNKMRSQHDVSSRRRRIDLYTDLLLVQGIMQKMQVRKRQKAALLDRKSAASQSRMKNVASLATDIPGPRKRRKGNEGTLKGHSRRSAYSRLLLPNLSLSVKWFVPMNRMTIWVPA